MCKFYVVCKAGLWSPVTTHLPVLARDAKHAVKIARGAGLIPYGVIAGK